MDAQVQRAASHPDPDVLHRRITDFSRPRLTGSIAAAEVRREAWRQLERLGYGVRALPFTFSAWPGLYGVSALGALLVVGLAFAWAALAASNAVLALLALAVVGALAAMALSFAGAAIRRLPIRRMSAENLLAVPSAPPTVLIVAHMDSKSQGVPTLVRAAAAGCVLLGWAVLVVTALVRGPQAAGWLALGTAIGAAGGLGLALGWTGNRSPGALDNATGLAALLELAARMREEPVAFLVTEAEELGLAGARAAADELDAFLAVVNLDGLDDHGPFLVLDGPGPFRRSLTPALRGAFREAAAVQELPLRHRSVPPGLMVDHMPFAAAGMPAVTVMRGTLRSLLRVHRPADRPERVSGVGAAAAVGLVEDAMNRLLQTSAAADEAWPC